MKNNWKELNKTKGRKEDLLQGYNVRARFHLDMKSKTTWALLEAS